MTRQASIAIAVVVWAISIVPAVLFVLWFGWVEWSFQGVVKAILGITMIVLAFELAKGLVERRLRLRQRPQSTSSTLER